METELYYFQGASSDGFDPEYGDLKFDGLHNIYGTLVRWHINYNNAMARVLFTSWRLQVAAMRRVFFTRSQ